MPHEHSEQPWSVWVDRRHPWYATYERHWEFLQQSYEGGPVYLAHNLHRFWREGDQDWAGRIARAHHYNFSRKVIDIFNGYLWEQQPTRKTDALPRPLQEFWQQADLEGQSINQVMMQRASPWAMVYGRVYAVVDKPVPQAETRAQELAQRAYVTFYHPRDVLDARLIDGKLEWVLLRETIRDDADPRSSSGVQETLYRLWTQNAWALYRKIVGKKDEVSVELVADGEHGLGEVPLVPIDHRVPINWFVAPSLIWEIAYLDRAVFNHISLLDENLYDTTFSQLRIPWQALTPGAQQSPGTTRSEVLEMGTKRVFTYDAGASTPPEWMAPPADPARVLMERIRQEIDDLFRHVALAGEMAVTVASASGISKEHDFRKLNKLLATQADNLEHAEKRMLRLAAMWHDLDPDKIGADVVDYPEDFDVQSLVEALDEIKAMAEAGLPDLVLNEARKAIVDRKFAKVTPEKLEALHQAIDAHVGVPVMDLEGALARRAAQGAPTNGS